MSRKDKMKIAYITTSNSLNEISIKGDIEFCLLPIALKSKEYKDYFLSAKKKRRYIIGDNLIAENAPISDEEFIKIALEIKVSELIIPDVIGDYEKTKIKREIFLKKYYKILSSNKIKIQSVVQGSNLQEYEQCLKEVNNDYRIDVIGLPFRMEYATFKNKTKEENHMLNRLLFINTFMFFKPIHCLGCNLPEEIKHLSYIKEIRSCDSKIFSRYGMNYRIFGNDDKVKPFTKLEILDSMTNRQIQITKDNINKLKKWLQNGR